MLFFTCSLLFGRDSLNGDIFRVICHLHISTPIPVKIKNIIILACRFRFSIATLPENPFSLPSPV